MAIFRGIGGAGDSTTDATVTAVTEQATNAANSATAAASSASSASTSASNASTSATNAAASASAASTSETNAAASEAAASASETAAAASEAAAAASETAAAASEAAASTSETNAAASASAASTSETNAAASAAAASTSETNAAASESAAATSASNASTSATAASNAQTAAEVAQAAAEAAQEAIDGLYLGAQASDPSVDLNGDAVTAGDWYYNTTTGVTRIYDGSVWNNGAVSTVGFLQTGNNLSDLGDAATARTNLGLGTAATTASTDYATAAQGTLADSATQPGDNISTLTNDSGYVTPSSVATFTNKSGNISQWTNDSGYLTSDVYTGTVTSVAATVPTGLTVSGSPITSSGTLAIAYDTGYSIPTTTKQGQWDTAYGWGDHSTQGYATTSLTVAKTSSTGSAVVPAGTQAQRDGSPSAGYFRFNSDTSSFEGYNGSAWGAVGGGATGGGNDAVFIENDQTVTTNYTIPSGKNAMSTGVVTINSGVTVTVSSGSRYVVI
jgi:hypothetical protein